jgi:hypothetical protein
MADITIEDISIKFIKLTFKSRFLAVTRSIERVDRLVDVKTK